MKPPVTGALFKAIQKHKILSLFTIAIVAGGAYWSYQTLHAGKTSTTYALGNVQKGTIIKTVTGTGQVSASNQIEVKPKVSSDIISLTVTNGQSVKAGDVIARLDATDAIKTLRDAQTNLETAKLNLEKLQSPPDTLSLTQSQNNLAKAQESRQSAIDDLQKSYDDGYTKVTNAFLDLPTVITGLQNLLYTSTSGLSNSGQWNLDFYSDQASMYGDNALQYRNDADTKYQIAKTEYDKNFNDYKQISRTADPETISKLIDETYQTTRNISEAIKSANNLIQFYKDKLSEHNVKTSSVADTQLASLSSYTGLINSHISNLFGIENTIQADKTSIVNAERTIDENTQSLAKLKAGADPLDIRSDNIAIQQKQQALTDAQTQLSDYTIKAPFDGTVAAVNVKKYDTVSSGTSIVTLITPQQIAEISLNEVDAAKVKTDQKVTLTFDAISDLSITGQVAEISTIGTVNQGVVSYDIKISFDTQDERVKPGMTVSASIITDVAQDVLTVPSSAIKSQGSNTYVEIFDPAAILTQTGDGYASSLPPKQQPVTTGLSDDTSTEITEGLSENQEIITRTATSNQTSQSSQTPSILGGGTRSATGASFRRFGD